MYNYSKPGFSYMRSFAYGILTLLLLAMLASSVEAYIITIDAPDKIFIGSPLVVTGNTTFPEHASFDILLYYSKYTANERAKQTVIVDKSKQFRIAFDTRGLDKGQYKVEVHDIISDNEKVVESQLGSASVIRKVVQFIDRSDEIIIESPDVQELTKALTLSGQVKDAPNGVIVIRIFGPDSFTYGPEQIRTTSSDTDVNGHFSVSVPVADVGEYQVSISDKTGFIGEYIVNVNNPDAAENEVTEEVTEVITEVPTPTPTTMISPITSVPTPIPTTQKSPIGILGIIIGLCFVCLIIRKI